MRIISENELNENKIVQLDGCEIDTKIKKFPKTFQKEIDYLVKQTRSYVESRHFSKGLSLDDNGKMIYMEGHFDQNKIGKKDIHAYVLTRNNQYTGESNLSDRFPFHVICVGTAEYAKKFFNALVEELQDDQRVKDEEIKIGNVISLDKIGFRRHKGTNQYFPAIISASMVSDVYFCSFQKDFTLTEVKGYANNLEKIEDFTIKFNKKNMEKFGFIDEEKELDESLEESDREEERN